MGKYSMEEEGKLPILRRSANVYEDVNALHRYDESSLECEHAERMV